MPVAEAATPRDETAFSIDPATGQPVSSLATLSAATAAMEALGDGRIDEAGYHAVVQHDDPIAAAAELPPVEATASTSGDGEAAAGAPESNPAAAEPAAPAK